MVDVGGGDQTVRLGPMQLSRGQSIVTSLRELVLHTWLCNAVAFVLSALLLLAAKAEADRAFETERDATDCIFEWQVSNATTQMSGGWSACLPRGSFVRAVVTDVASSSSRDHDDNVDDFFGTEPWNAATRGLATAWVVGWSLLFCGLMHVFVASPWHVLNDSVRHWRFFQRQHGLRAPPNRPNRPHQGHQGPTAPPSPPSPPSPPPSPIGGSLGHRQVALLRLERAREEATLSHVRGAHIFLLQWLGWFVLHWIRLRWIDHSGYGLILPDGLEAAVSVTSTAVAADARNVTFALTVDAHDTLVHVRGLSIARTVTTTVPFEAIDTYREAVHMAYGMLLGVFSVLAIAIGVGWHMLLLWDLRRSYENEMGRMRRTLAAAEPRPRVSFLTVHPAAVADTNEANQSAATAVAVTVHEQRSPARSHGVRFSQSAASGK